MTGPTCTLPVWRLASILPTDIRPFGGSIGSPAQRAITRPTQGPTKPRMKRSVRDPIPGPTVVRLPAWHDLWMIRIHGAVSALELCRATSMLARPDLSIRVIANARPELATRIATNALAEPASVDHLLDVLASSHSDVRVRGPTCGAAISSAPSRDSLLRSPELSPAGTSDEDLHRHTQTPKSYSLWKRRVVCWTGSQPASTSISR